MARTESRTKTAIWAPDGEFVNLTGRAQRMYWLLYSQPTITLCGVLALTERRWARSAKDESLETVGEALQELQDENFILVDYETEEVLVRTFARHDGVKPRSTVWGKAWEALTAIQSKRLRDAAEAELARIGPPPDGVSTGCRNTQSDTSSDTPSEEQMNGVSHTPSDAPPDTSRARARAVSVSSLRLQSPSPSPAPIPPHGGRDRPHSGGDRDEPPDRQAHRKLVIQLADICHGKNPRVVLKEAGQVVVWALAKVDRAIVEEAIATCAAFDKPPDLPRTVATVIRQKAHDRRIDLEAFQP